MNDNGKYHCSVVGPMLFPLEDLMQVVPASLHIILGIALLQYNLLLDECKKIDLAEGFRAFEEQKAKLSKDWEIASLEVHKYGNDAKEHGENVAIMTNRLHRCKEAMSEDQFENQRLAEQSDTRRKQRFCYITVHDINVEWVLCDFCNN